MKRLLLVLLCIHSTLIFSQKTFETISSYKLGEDREISISLPESYTKNPDKRYPLLVLLDGDYLVDPFQGALTYGAYWDDIPEVIIVGISQNKNNERETDCSVDDNTTGLPTDKGINCELFSSLTCHFIAFCCCTFNNCSIFSICFVPMKEFISLINPPYPSSCTSQSGLISPSAVLNFDLSMP